MGPTVLLGRGREDKATVFGCALAYHFSKRSVGINIRVVDVVNLLQIVLNLPMVDDALHGR
jgi:hypothetical protein